MIIREYKSSDLEQLKRLHDGQEYEFPDPAHPLMIVKDCLEDAGRVRAAGLARLELNVTLLLDHEWATPGRRLEAVKSLQDSMHKKASYFGLDQAYAEVSSRWGHRLEGLGWIPAKNRLYFLRIN